jgi:hypothetical protein
VDLNIIEVLRLLRLTQTSRGSDKEKKFLHLESTLQLNKVVHTQ